MNHSSSTLTSLHGTALLDDNVALLTGANGGIGLEVARAYLSCGASCMLADITEAPSSDVAQLLAQYPNKASYQRCDVTHSADRRALVEATIVQFKGIDILFNNAAIFDMGPLLDSTESQFDALFDVNVKGLFFLMQCVATHMVDTQRQGRIINMASQAGRRGEALVAHYCATKAAVISYTQSAALALAKHHIRVNAISPGVVDTPMWDDVDALFAKYEHRPRGEKKRLVGESVPLGRMGTPDDLVGAAVFLASSLSSYITAQTYNVDGGNVMS